MGPEWIVVGVITAIVLVMLILAGVLPRRRR
jgi:hypothetical protein